MKSWRTKWWHILKCEPAVLLCGWDALGHSTLILRGTKESFTSCCDIQVSWMSLGHAYVFADWLFFDGLRCSWTGAGPTFLAEGHFLVPSILHNNYHPSPGSYWIHVNAAKETLRSSPDLFGCPGATKAEKGLWSGSTGRWAFSHLCRAELRPSAAGSSLPSRPRRDPERTHGERGAVLGSWDSLLFSLFMQVSHTAWVSGKRNNQSAWNCM